MLEMRDGKTLQHLMTHLYPELLACGVHLALNAKVTGLPLLLLDRSCQSPGGLRRKMFPKCLVLGFLFLIMVRKGKNNMGEHFRNARSLEGNKECPEAEGKVQDWVQNWINGEHAAPNVQAETDMPLWTRGLTQSLGAPRAAAVLPQL